MRYGSEGQRERNQEMDGRNISYKVIVQSRLKGIIPRIPNLRHPTPSVYKYQVLVQKLQMPHILRCLPFHGLLDQITDPFLEDFLVHHPSFVEEPAVAFSILHLPASQ